MTFRVLDGVISRVFAVGDIHGCVDELQVLLHALISEERISHSDRIVFLGDYIDRGPSSRAVIDAVLGLERTLPGQCVFLKGNHEDMLLSFLGRSGQQGRAYLINGGIETLRSYGVADSATGSELCAAIPREHLDFFERLERGALWGKFFCVHAGVHPLAPLDEQTDRDLFWIRDEFIMNVHKLNKTVVFGHTPFESILQHPPFKLGIDTGLVFGNKLSAVELASGSVLQVKRHGASVTRSKIPMS